MEWLSFIGLAAAGLFPLVNPLGAVPLFASLTQDFPKSAQRKQAIRASVFAFCILAISLLAGQAVLNFFDLSLGMLQIAGGLIVGNTAWQMSTGNNRLSHSDIRRLHHRGFKTSLVEAAGGFVSTVAELPHKVTELPAHVAQATHLKTANDNDEPRATGETPDDQGESGADDQAVPDISFSPMAMPMLAGPGAIGVAIGLAAQGTAPLDTVGSLIGIAVIAVLSVVCLLAAGGINNRLGPSGIDAMTRIFGFIVLGIAVALIANGISSLFGVTLHGTTG